MFLSKPEFCKLYLFALPWNWDAITPMWNKYSILRSAIYTYVIDECPIQCLVSTFKNLMSIIRTLQWRRNEHDGVSNHRRLDCLLNRLFREDQRKHQNSASLAFVREIHRSPVNSPYKGPVTRKCFHLMTSSCVSDTVMCRQSASGWALKI